VIVSVVIADWEQCTPKAAAIVMQARVLQVM
jgi:hypothetical protein